MKWLRTHTSSIECRSLEYILNHSAVHKSTRNSILNPSLVAFPCWTYFIVLSSFLLHPLMAIILMTSTFCLPDSRVKVDLKNVFRQTRGWLGLIYILRVLTRLSKRKCDMHKGKRVFRVVTRYVAPTQPPISNTHSNSLPALPAAQCQQTQARDFNWKTSRRTM